MKQIVDLNNIKSLPPCASRLLLRSHKPIAVNMGQMIPSLIVTDKTAESNDAKDFELVLKPL